MLRLARDAAVRDRRAACPRPQGEVISAYQFAGGASPATTPRASLPVLPKAAYALACDLFDGIAAAAGLTAVKEARRGRGEATPMCFELDADTEIETRDHGVMTVAELERLMRARRARANAPATLRCSGSFHDPTRVRTDCHLINWGRYGLGIYDTMTETTWHRRERAPSARFRIFGSITRRNRPCAMDEQRHFDGDAISRADREFLASLGDHPLGATPALQRAVPAAARFRVHFDPKDKEQTAERQVLRGRPRLDAGELRLSRRRLHGQRRHHLAG